MSTPVFYRRRAERFAQILDEANGVRHAHSQADDDLADLATLGHRISGLQSSVSANPDFRTELRALLIATAEREGIGTTSTVSPQRSRQPKSFIPHQLTVVGRRTKVRAAIIAGVAIGAITVSGISAASENSLPGDTFYGMKRSTERAQLALAGSDINRGQLHLDLARTRLAEAGAMQGNGANFTSLLDQMDGNIRQGVKLLTNAATQRHSDDPLNVVAALLTEQHRGVARLLDRAGTDEERVRTSLALLDSAIKRVNALRACGPDPADSTDALGPLADSCAAGNGSSKLPK